MSLVARADHLRPQWQARRHRLLRRDHRPEAVCGSRGAAAVQPCHARRAQPAVHARRRRLHRRRFRGGEMMASRCLFIDQSRFLGAHAGCGRQSAMLRQAFPRCTGGSFLACRRMRTTTPCLTSLGQNPQAVKTSLGLPSSIKLGQYDALAAFSANPTGSGRKVYTTEVRICTPALNVQKRRPSAVGRLATDRRRRRIYKLHADRLHARHFVWCCCCARHLQSLGHVLTP